MTDVRKAEYGGLDLFRIAAALLVITIHISPLGRINGTADFILTRVLARLAVPFFFTVSGFFLFSRAKGESPAPLRLKKFLGKLLVLYAFSTLLYLPLTIYAGKARAWGSPLVLLHVILFDGTYYHLWYFPAAALGACIAWLLIKRLQPRFAFAVSLLLYLVGLLGDSYYGLAAQIPPVKAFYGFLFLLFKYTRSGLFLAPVFFVLGAFLNGRTKKLPLKTCCAGFAVSFALMLAEGLTLHALHVQRRDSMYLMLLPCLFFLFNGLLLYRGKSSKRLRDISMLVYVLHPAVIVAVRFFARAVGLQRLLIENNLVLFAAVAAGSFAAAMAITVLPHGRQAFRERRVQRQESRAWAEIDLRNLRHNAAVLQGALPRGCRLMAVVKANAYGHGDKAICSCLNRAGVRAFAVATIEEGIALRKKGVKGEILILGYTPAERAGELCRYRLSQTVADAAHARELDRFGKPVRVHIKVNTGMNRLGENSQNISEIADIFVCKNLTIEGIFTHLCACDSTDPSEVAFTNGQIASFYALLEELRVCKLQIPKVHLQSSYGVLNYPALRCGYARVGIALYGALSTPGTAAGFAPSLRPVLSLKSRVALLRTIRAGESVGYGREFIARQETAIAVVSIGYADGCPRSLSRGGGAVLIGGHRAPIVGRVCMDQLTVDVTGLPSVKRGDVVTLIGRDGGETITAEEMAACTGTITNELFSRLGGRLERIVLGR